MAFSNPLVQLILPNGADPNVGPVIFLDGTTGKIVVIGSSGGRIEIDPNNIEPQLHFFSNDGTNDAFINAVSTGSNVDLGLNSGVFTPADGVPRRGRLFFADSNDIVDLGVINSATQNRQGGWIRTTAENAFTGYDDSSLAGGPFHAYFIYDKTGAILQIQNGATTKEFHFNTTQALFDGDFVLHESTAVFKRVADIVNPLHFQNDRASSGVVTVTTTTPSTIPNTPFSVVTSIATAKVHIDMVFDMIINIAGSTGVGQLVVDSVVQSKQAIMSGPVGMRATVSQHYDVTLSGAGLHNFSMQAQAAAAAQSISMQALHTSYVVDVYE